MRTREAALSGAILSERFDEALLFAARIHREQRRKGSETPYIAHLLAVTSLVIENGGGEEEAIAALLHDAREDQGVTTQELERMFGTRVASIVEACTDGTPDPQTGEKRDWRTRKEAYIAHLDQATRGQLLVSAADKLHNARTILADYRQFGEALWDRFKGGREGTLWYYGSLADRFPALLDSPIVEELTRTVSEIERLAARDLG
jgi:GTP pyrophosphokinase